MAKDENIASIQEALAICGCYPGSYDGVMGPKTKGAIKEFQGTVGLSADGACGPNTKAALAEHLGAKIVRASALKGYFEGGGTSASDDM